MPLDAFTLSPKRTVLFLVGISFLAITIRDSSSIELRNGSGIYKGHWQQDKEQEVGFEIHCFPSWWITKTEPEVYKNLRTRL